MSFDVYSVPLVTEAELDRRIEASVDHQEFLLFRADAPSELDAFFNPDGKRYWEMHCTKCGETFLERKTMPGSKYKRCPRCGADVTPRRWTARLKCLDSVKFAFHMFQKGAGGAVWLRSFEVRLNRDIENTDGIKYETREYMRVAYSSGGAERWVMGFRGWKRMRDVRMRRWAPLYGYAYPDAFDDYRDDEIRGSCLGYSQCEDAMKTDVDIARYLAEYLKYPACEYVWKMGLGRFFEEKGKNGIRGFGGVINLRAKSPAKLFPGLTKEELRFIRQNPGVKLAHVVIYKRLKKLGAADNAGSGFRYAAALHDANTDAERLAERCGVDVRTLFKYYEKQAARSLFGLYYILRDHRDYLRQLDAAEAADADPLPRDLREAHERLSARVKKFGSAELNAKFRVRRRLLRKYSWKRAGLFIRPADSPNELFREGEAQRNCVASYAERHAEGNIAIFLLRRKDAPRQSWHTVELDLAALAVRQCRGFRNSNAEAEAKEFIRAWEKHVRALADGAGARVRIGKAE